MRRPTQQENAIYRTYCAMFGESKADSWLKERLAEDSSSNTAPSTEREQPDSGRMQPVAGAVSALSRQIEHNQARRARRLAEQPLQGREATDEAARIIGPRWREELGVAYPLVLLLVRGAVEAGHSPTADNANSYHCFSTHARLGVAAAALIGRDMPYSQKTIQRWLHEDAPHARALRSWLGWKTWYTDTMREYREGEGFNTGESVGPVVGGHVYRVMLNPLNNRNPHVYPEGEQLKYLWRDIEADRHAGRTARTAEYDYEEVCVHIEREPTKAIHVGGPALQDIKSNSSCGVEILEQEYVYPDTHTYEGAMQLVQDVNHAAGTLINRIQGAVSPGRREALMQRYRHAVWIAVKAERYGGTRRGFDLLRQGCQLAAELREEHHGLHDVGAFVWSELEKRGYQELRRDYGYQPGRFMRVLPPSMAKKIMEGDEGKVIEA